MVVSGGVGVVSGVVMSSDAHADLLNEVPISLPGGVIMLLDVYTIVGNIKIA